MSRFGLFLLILGDFPYIILFNWCLTAKFANFNRSQNFVDLQNPTPINQS